MSQLDRHIETHTHERPGETPSRDAAPSTTQVNVAADHRAPARSSLAREISAIGYILAVSYPVLALSTGARAAYQLFVRDDIVDYFPPIMSGVAAICYLLATIGFVHRRRWSWWLSVTVLGIETTLTLVVGIWSYVDPVLIGRTVWRHFGEDYGFFPLFQPILGLIWLLWPATMREYGLGARFVARLTRPVRGLSTARAANNPHADNS